MVATAKRESWFERAAQHLTETLCSLGRAQGHFAAQRILADERRLAAELRGRLLDDAAARIRGAGVRS